jgi:hypothetical protein
VGEAVTGAAGDGGDPEAAAGDAEAADGDAEAAAFVDGAPVAEAPPHAAAKAEDMRKKDKVKRGRMG